MEDSNIVFHKDTEKNYHFIDGLNITIEPYKGKYAVINKDVFSILKKRLDEKMDTNWRYKPLRFEVELTNQCNDHCKSCGMSASNIDNGTKLCNSKIDHIINSFSNLGIPSISITGGEPFLNFEELKYFVKTARNKIDISKITTNGFWGDRANDILCILADNGLLENNFFVPVLMLSIGQQSTPLKVICKIIKSAITQFSKNELTLCISSLAEKNEKHKIDNLINEYNNLYGDFPFNRVYLTIRNYVDPKNEIKLFNDNKYSLEQLTTRCYDCFRHSVGSFVLPTALLKLSGDIYTCASFNVPEKLKIGNIYENNLYDILNTANNNKYINTIATFGLKGLYKQLSSVKKENIYLDNYCEACNFLLSNL